MQPLIHLAIRLSDKLYNVPSAIHRHIRVSCRHGAVWLPGKVRQDRCGKPNRGLPKSLVDTLNRQIEAGYPAWQGSYLALLGICKKRNLLWTKI
jgi:hypothetical protein